MHFHKKYLLIQSIIALCLILMAELFVRYEGYAPGDLRPAWSNFHPVDTLIVYDDFVVDSNGILIANAAHFKEMGVAINSDGFRAPDFGSLDTARYKLLLIGDSFTWGLSARPLDSCFADLLKTKVHATAINTGIPSADPAQYEEIARKYIPRLKPERVVVVFFLGNDIMQQERPIVPYRPFYYYTNAGAMMADDGNIHFNSAQEAYDYYTKKKFFLLHPSCLCETIISKSALLSRIYSLRYRWEEKKDAENAIKDMSITKRHLYAICNICAANCCKVNIVLIPERKEAGKPYSFFEERYKDLFKDQKLSRYIYMPSSGNSPDNYTSYPDAHLNNKGHAFYARSISSLISPEAGQ